MTKLKDETKPVFEPVDNTTPRHLLSEVEVYQISDEERMQMQDALSAMPNPYGSGVLKALRFIRDNPGILPNVLREAVYMHGNSAHAPAFIMVKNCPKDDYLGVPDKEGYPPSGKNTFIAEGFSLAFVHSMGMLPVAMANEWHEELVQNLVQIEKKAHEQSSASAATDLGNHVDDLSSGDKRVAKTILRLLQVPNNRPYTVFSDAAKAVQFLLENKLKLAVDILQRNDIQACPPVSQRAGQPVNALLLSEKMKVLSGSLECPQLNLEFLDDTVVIAENNPDPHASVRWAMQKYAEASAAVSVKVMLPVDALVSFDNRRGQHGRLKWKACYEPGQLRWGVRVNALADPFRSRGHSGHLLKL